MRVKVTLAGLLLAAASAQNLPPGVLLLSQIKRHVQQELKQLPNVSCLETVEREHQPPHGKMAPLDTVRLEVLTNGGKELFASPGDRKFSENHPISYAGSGVIGTGFFGLYLRSVVVSRLPLFTNTKARTKSAGAAWRIGILSCLRPGAANRWRSWKVRARSACTARSGPIHKRWTWSGWR